MGIDVMNRNSIVSLAMLFALWESNQKDLLALIRPFILYAVGQNMKSGDVIDIGTICAYMEKEFGYRSFQPAVVRKVLARETSTAIKKEKRLIEKKDGAYFLISSLSEFSDSFRAKRTACKTRSDKVTTALAAFLNEKRACKRDNYSQEESERLLLSFFEKQGSSILLSVDDLRQMTCRKNELDYFVGKFILEQNEKQSALMDYLIELVKGYFVTAAIYMQAENPNITTAAFRNVTFYLDTRLLLAFLGLKSKQENDSVREMVNSLLRNGAKLACFDYNIDEVDKILEAYKQSRLNLSKKPSNITLEYFDEHNASYSIVEATQKVFASRLERAEIIPISTCDALERAKVTDSSKGLLNEERLEEIIKGIKPKYNVTTLADDLQAINTVSRIRCGRKLDYIEKCRAIFATSNIVLVAAIREYCKENSLEFGFPIAISEEDLCVVAWLKDFEQNNALPHMRLLENVLAAITPSQELMDAYFSNLEYLEEQGELGTDEAALLRVDLFARKELMELTFGEKSNLTKPVIETIRRKLRADSINAGIEQGRRDAQKAQDAELQRRRNAACKRAEDEVELEYKKKEKRTVRAIKFISLIIAVLFVIATIGSFSAQLGKWKMAADFVAVISTIEAVVPFVGNDNWIIRKAKQELCRRKEFAADKKKKLYLSIIDGSVSPTQ